jgi:hypothetical protein
MTDVLIDVADPHPRSRVRVLDTKISYIDASIIAPIQLDKGYGYVITVPQSTSRGAHQALDKKYYLRQNLQSIAMEDYEIRD